MGSDREPLHHHRAARVRCPICGNARSLAEMIPASLVRAPLAELIRREHPAWGGSEGMICLDDLHRFRMAHVRELLAAKDGLSEAERAVLRSLETQELVAADADAAYDERAILGERVADRVAAFGGSWTFIAIFGATIAGWMLLNALLIHWEGAAFDPYPYILLNLVLSCLAAVQAPVIMMSQNRQETKDRARAENDYRVNLKAELEVRRLHEKLDHLLHELWPRLLEIQEAQAELIDELAARRGEARPFPCAELPAPEADRDR
jgi:uncharacterized membrane protein